MVGKLLHFEGALAETFDIFIQLGAILAVVWHYRGKVWEVLTRFYRPSLEQRLLFHVILAFLPAALVGLILHRWITEHLFRPETVAGALIVGGIVILGLERRPLTPTITSVDTMTPMKAFQVGLFQTLALFPGVSRSGATIMGSLYLGFSRPIATEFSFFLAIPTMLAATGYALYRHHELLNLQTVPVLLIGFVSAFLVARLVITLFLGYVAQHDFKLFAYYRILIGIMVLMFLG